MYNFVHRLMDLEWRDLYQCENPDAAWLIVERNILNIIDTMCPTQTFLIKNLKDPWISQEILKAIKDKDRLLSKAKKSNLHEDWILARRRRNEVKKIVKNAKSDFIKENLTRHENDSKKLWKSLRDIIPSSKNQKSNKIISKK